MVLAVGLSFEDNNPSIDKLNGQYFDLGVSPVTNIDIGFTLVFV